MRHHIALRVGTVLRFETFISRICVSTIWIFATTEHLPFYDLLSLTIQRDQDNSRSDRMY